MSQIFRFWSTFIDNGMRRLPILHQFHPRSIQLHPRVLTRLRPFTTSHSLNFSSPKTAGRHPSTVLHGTDLPPRPDSTPFSFRRYIFSKDYLLRGIYRSLLIAVFVIPVIILWDGPIKVNHVDGEYEPFDLVERQEIAKGHSYFILKRQKPKRYWWAWYEKEIPETIFLASRTPIMSLRIKNPSLQIQRSYTPLNLSSDEIHLVIKRYPDGELSRFLHILTPGKATVWVNQGRQEWIFEEGEWDHIVFIAGGTGITPAFQLCLNALQRQKLRGEVDAGLKKTKFTVLAAARNAESLLLRNEFQMMDKVHGEGLLNVKYFLDTVPKGMKLPNDIQPGPITEKVIRDAIAPPMSKGWFSWSNMTPVTAGKVMVLVCGPDGFTKYISGEHGGVPSKQGEKGGLLRDVDGIEVFKMLESRDQDVLTKPRKEKRGMPVMKIE